MISTGHHDRAPLDRLVAADRGLVRISPDAFPMGSGDSHYCVRMTTAADAVKMADLLVTKSVEAFGLAATVAAIESSKNIVLNCQRGNDTGAEEAPSTERTT